MPHLLTPPGVHHRRPPLWVRVRCAGCTLMFEANAHSVPVLGNPDTGGGPSCRGCWRRLNLLRRTANLPEWDTPEDAYPDADPDQVASDIPTAGRRLIVP